MVGAGAISPTVKPSSTPESPNRSAEPWSTSRRITGVQERVVIPNVADDTERAVLVIGGAGFIGSHLVDRLIAEGESVDVIDDLSTGSLANLADARSGLASSRPPRRQLGERTAIHTVDASPTSWPA